MKKLLLVLFAVFLLVGCETQEERNERKKQEEINRIKEELKTEEIPEEAKDWLVDAKTNKLVTIFCMSTSKKCESLSKDIDEIKKEYDIKVYIFNFDEINETTSNIYKTTYKLTDYTGYLPYIILSDKDVLLKTHTDTLNKDDLITLLKDNKIINQED